MDLRTRKLMTLRPRDDGDRLYVTRREEGRELASIEDSVDASIQRLEDYVGKHEKKNPKKNNTNDTRTSGTTITRKQKWEEKQLNGRFKQLTSNV